MGERGGREFGRGRERREVLWGRGGGEGGEGGGWGEEEEDIEEFEVLEGAFGMRKSFWVAMLFSVVLGVLLPWGDLLFILGTGLLFLLFFGCCCCCCYYNYVV